MDSVGTWKRIQLLKVVNNKTAAGNWGVPSKTRYTTYAEVTRGSGSRNYQNGQTVLGDSYTFKVRYNGSLDMNAQWQLVYDKRQFTVTSIGRDKEKKFYWIIEATSHGRV